MNSKLLYPKTIEYLLEKITYTIENDENKEKNLNLYNWREWFNEQKYNHEYICEEKEFLKVFYDNEKYALQVWIHGEDVDYLKFNLLSNYYSEYDTDITLIKESSD